MVDWFMSERPLWTCPKCGNHFTTRNTYHSCGNVPIEDHFARKEAHVRDIFDAYVAAAEQFGPLKVYGQKTRIVLQARTRFATAIPRKRWLTGHIWLKRKAEHPLIYRHEMWVFRDYGNIFRIKDPADIDSEFTKIIQEAYVLGS